MNRNVSGRIAAGVCAAIAHRFGWEPMVVRILFIVSLAFGGLAFWVYAAAWLIIPFNAGDRAPLKKMLDTVSGFFSDKPGSIETL